MAARQVECGTGIRRWNGAPFESNQFGREFAELSKAARFLKFTCHNWRHSHATSRPLHGINVTVDSERLGRSSIVVTLDIYSHVHNEQAAEVANKLQITLGDSVQFAA